MKKKPSKGATIAAFVALALVAACCVGGIVIATSGDKDGKPADQSIDAAVMCEDFVKKQLKAPASAKFSDEKTTKVSDAEYVTTGAIDSQNSFGAMLRSHFRCDLTVSGDTWTSKSVDVTAG